MYKSIPLTTAKQHSENIKINFIFHNDLENDQRIYRYLLIFIGQIITK